MSHSFLTFGCEPSAVVDRERPSVCGSLLWGRYLLQQGKKKRLSSSGVCSFSSTCGERKKETKAKASVTEFVIIIYEVF